MIAMTTNNSMSVNPLDLLVTADTPCRNRLAAPLLWGAYYSNGNCEHPPFSRRLKLPSAPKCAARFPMEDVSMAPSTWGGADPPVRPLRPSAPWAAQHR